MPRKKVDEAGEEPEVTPQPQAEEQTAPVVGTEASPEPETVPDAEPESEAAETPADESEGGEPEAVAAEPQAEAAPEAAAAEQPAGHGAPDMSSGADDAPEAVVKSGGRKIRVKGFFGSFHKAVFAEEQAFPGWGVADVTDETLSMLKDEFPGAEIEDVD